MKKIKMKSWCVFLPPFIYSVRLSKWSLYNEHPPTHPVPFLRQTPDANKIDFGPSKHVSYWLGQDETYGWSRARRTRGAIQACGKSVRNHPHAMLWSHAYLQAFYKYPHMYPTDSVRYMWAPYVPLQMPNGLGNGHMISYAGTVWAHANALSTGQMPRLIGVSAGHISHFAGFVMLHLTGWNIKWN